MDVASAPKVAMRSQSPVICGPTIPVQITGIKPGGINDNVEAVVSRFHIDAVLIDRHNRIIPQVDKLDIGAIERVRALRPMLDQAQPVLD